MGKVASAAGGQSGIKVLFQKTYPFLKAPGGYFGLYRAIVSVEGAFCLVYLHHRSGPFKLLSIQQALDDAGVVFREGERRQVDAPSRYTCPGYSPAGPCV